MPFKAVDIVGISILVDYAEMFREAGADVDLVVNPCSFEASADEIVAAIGDADIVITQTTFQAFPRSVLSRLNNCRLITSIGVGCESLDIDAATELGILAVNVPDASIREVSDHTMALILACTRRLFQLNDIVKKGGWKAIGDPYITGEIWPGLSKLEGQTLGLIAFGRIARAVVPKAKAFGMRVIAYDPYVSSEVFRNLDVEQVDLDRLLTESDIVSIHAPLTPETEGMIGLEELRKMKPTACLVNTGRGSVVDNEALYTALAEGYIAMAAVDVTEPEPIPAGSPLLKLDNFIITAHSAGISPQAFTELQRRPGKEIIRFVQGEWPVGLLDPRMKETYSQRWGPL
ncbi:MAG: C-terminal binding protein [Dehalococcoidia bacterium]|nr:MAG: C-terminal binding protein [Dehalococcoidia bacterium]